MFTKGKWKATDFVMLGGRRYDIETSEEVIASDVSEANAQLITSAPKLYGALKDVGRELRINDSTWGHGIFIRLSDWKEHYEPIIAKAEGK